MFLPLGVYNTESSIGSNEMVSKFDYNNIDNEIEYASDCLLASNIDSNL